MKKLCALLLCMTMLLSLVPVAQAENTYYRTDEFDTDPLGDFNPIEYRGNYPTSNPKGSQTDIVGNGTSWTNKGGGVGYTIISDGAYQGQALKLSKADNYAGDKYYISTEDLPAHSDENPVYVNMKLKIVSDGYDGVNTSTRQSLTFTGGGANLLYIKENNGPKIWPWRDGFNGDEVVPATRIPYELNRWYDVTFKFTSGYAYTTVKDAFGNVATGRIEATKNTGVKIESDTINTSEIIIDEMYMIQGEDALNLVSTTEGADPVTKTVDVHEDFNFATPTPSNGNTTEPFSWYMRVDSPLAASSGLGTAVGYFGSTYCSVEMVDDCNGGYAPKITPVSGKVTNLNIGAVDITATEKAFVSFKFKYESTATAGAHILDMGFGTATSTASSAGYDFRIKAGNFDSWNYWGRGGRNYQPFCSNLPDVWYTIVVEFQKVNDVNQAVLYVYDDLGNRIIYQPPVAGQSPSKTIAKATIGFTEIAANVETYYFDDCRVLQTPASTDSEVFIRQEILGETIATTTPVAVVEFNQIVAEGSSAKFVAGEEEIPAVIDYAGGSPFVEIKPATPLNYGTSYTLDLSGIKTLSGAGIATGINALAFKTPAYSLGTMTLGDVAVSGTTLTVPVTFANAAYKEVYTKLIAALYDASGNLAWVDFKDVKNAEMGLNTFTFTGLPEGADVNNIKVFAWDNFQAMMPLYR